MLKGQSLSAIPNITEMYSNHLFLGPLFMGQVTISLFVKLLFIVTEVTKRDPKEIKTASTKHGSKPSFIFVEFRLVVVSVGS